MLSATRALVALLALVAIGCLTEVEARQMTKQQLRARQLEAAARFAPQRRARGGSSAPKNITFSNPKASGALSGAINAI